MSNNGTPRLTPRLICKDADAAIRFYQEVFGAKLLERYAMPEGPVVHAALQIQEAIFSVVDASEHNQAPGAEGPGVIMELQAEDPDAIFAAAKKAGAEVVFELADQFYGRREGRFRDPFGHLWIPGKQIQDMSPEQIQKGVDEFETSK